jgi:hypothetical protein
MRAAIFQGKGEIAIADVPDPVIQNPDEAIVKVTHSCICGSDLWFYRGLSSQGERIGYEFMGVVEAVGDDVLTVKAGDFVIAPFVISDGTCPECRAGETRFCRHGMFWGTNGYDGGQGEKVRLPFADGTLVVVPAGNDLDDHMLKALLPLTDVLSTGHHAALDGRVSNGSTVALIGTGPSASALSPPANDSAPPASAWSAPTKTGPKSAPSSAQPTSSTRAARTLSSKSRKPPTISVSTPPSNASEPPTPGPLPSTLSGSVATSASSASPTTSPTCR